MTEVRRKVGQHYVRFDGMTWPALDSPTSDAESLGWRCRYARDDITDTDLLVLASIIEAYNYLILMPQIRRNRICKNIRELSGSV